MSKLFTKRFYLSLVLGGLINFGALAQTTISGSVVDSNTRETLLGVSIVVKGKVIGTISDTDGNFKLSVSSAPPMTLVFSMVGYTSTEIEINDANVQGLEISLEESAILGQEVVVSASRVEESILESPVSIEKLDILAVQNTASDDYYKGLANIKGVDVNSSSINFQIVNTRGFASNGNTRFVQQTDGMDTQAPGLNFPVGNLNGPSVIDVESLELIPGSSSAIYGANAFNGILLVNSKNPFDYQGLSAYYKVGVNHVGSNADQDAAMMNEMAIRYAKAFNNKLAVKVNFSYMQADDWHGTSAFDRNASINPFPNEENISADRLHYMGDEANLNMNILRFSTTSGGSVGWQTPASSGDGVFEPGITAWQYSQSGFLPNHIIAAPSYEEKYIVDYGAKNLKANAGLYYRLNDELELSYLFNYGFGTTVYTGAQRYSLKNFAIQQHRLQLRGDNFYIRAYTTRENSGDSFIAEFLAKRVNDERYGGDVSNYLTTYPIYYLESLYNQGFRPSDDPNNVTSDQSWQAHEYAMGVMDAAFPLDPESKQFEEYKNKVSEGEVPFGPKFNDNSGMYHVEGQYDFKNQIDAISLQTGASFRMFDLKSNGTVFDDLGGRTIKEYGGYAQASKKIANDRVNLLASVRYDKNENFDGQFSPKLAAVWTFMESHNLRISAQRGFRNPTNQGQYIDLDIISARLLGGLPRVNEKYKLTENSYPVSVVNEWTDALFESNGNPFDPALVDEYLTGNELTEFNAVQPETVKAFEIGYKSLLSNNLMIDLVGYYNIYNNFITQIQARKYSELADGSPNYASLMRGSTLTLLSDGSFEGNTAQFYTNIDRQVTAQGAAIGLTYSLSGGYTIGGNYNWNVLNDEDKLAAEGFISEFNTPEHKFNISFANRKLTENLGFNVTYRWQDAFLWQSSFAIGEVEAYATLDAQVSYKISNLKSVVKLGGSNLTNDFYNTSLGGPNIGAIYYVSITFDEFMN
ncbi:MAG: TonB-dependent receptor [Reichenbachiella sp.]|uniref:TonB-dependent receptor n=1 Tax=Reichenbachiella sp. TaxID=2184521 RepID=UPI003296BDC2